VEEAVGAAVVVRRLRLKLTTATPRLRFIPGVPGAVHANQRIRITELLNRHRIKFGTLSCVFFCRTT
jgi:hypothetical protein